MIPSGDGAFLGGASQYWMIEVWEMGAGKAEDVMGRKAQCHMNLEHYLKSEGESP